ncbi:MAG: hypothetical protein COV45_01165 [Deltaproteobacteria bacterium CG11_big_fil_rev_8_21_14_0_20_47_16]|nr:MAG: hypothetical protein COV45_01165 [Deltaproteobacteria bacterium CG11_big_fil_rev_8_21_14_0_20_47_16]
MLQFLHHESRALFKAITNPVFIYLAMVGTIVMLTAASLLYSIEFGVNPRINNFMDCIWWGVATITTVGYGDIVPVTVVGKWIGIVLMYAGTTLFISFTGFLVTFWTRRTLEEEISPIERKVNFEKREIDIIMDRLDRIERRLGEKK